MQDNIGVYVFWAMCAGIVYMMIFRTKDFMALNDHMSNNLKDAGKGVAKGADVGLGLYKKYKK